MTALRRRIGSFVMSATALAFGAALVSCGGGGGGGGGGDDRIRLYFGINNDGDCSAIQFDVDVVDARAVIERNASSVDCALNAALAANGCGVDFELRDNGESLRVTISGCTIPSVTNVFLCDFIDADISDLTDETEAICTCRQGSCDTTPPVCISEDIDPGSCEDCDNLVDDDVNGFIDCDDENCEYSPLCGGDGTTTTTTVDSSTTTTTSLSTTTTLPIVTETCTIRYRMTTGITVGSMQWETDYSAAPGVIRGSGSSTRCTNITPGALAAFDDNDQTKTLSAGLVSLTGFTGPVDLVECKFDAFDDVQASDFDITVIEATDLDIEPIVPLPSVIVQSVECIPATTTTTITGGSTTTTLDGGDTTTTTLDGGGTTTTTLDGGGTTTTTVPDNDPGNLRFRLLSASAPLGALQFTVNYTGASGEFEGSGAAVTCIGKIEGALFAPNDKDGQRELSLGIIALDAFSAPVDVASCVFVPTNENDPPVPSDFVITIEDATDASGNDVTVEVGAVIVTP